MYNTSECREKGRERMTKVSEEKRDNGKGQGEEGRG